MGQYLTYLSGAASTEKQSEFRALPTGLAYAATAMQGWRRNMEDAHLADFEFSQPSTTQSATQRSNPTDDDAPKETENNLTETSAAAVATSNSTDALDSAQPCSSTDNTSTENASSDNGASCGDPASKKRKLGETNEDRDGWAEGTHIFGVFDGHGGKGVATFVSKHLPQHLRETWREGVMVENALREAFLNIDQNLISPDGRIEVKDLDSKPNIAPQVPIRVPKAEAHWMLEQNGQSLSEFAENSCTDGYYELDDTVMRRGEPTPESQGCTAVVVIYFSPSEDAPYGKLICANAGDSRAVLCRGEEAIALSEDHKPLSTIESARIRKAGGTVGVMQTGDVRVCGDLNLSRAFGDFRFKNNSAISQAEQIITCVPDFTSHVLTKDDRFVILACDGIWESKTNQEAVDFVNRKNIQEVPDDQLTKITEALCDDVVCPSMSAENPAFDGLGCDNMTVLLVRLPMTQEKNE